MTDHFNFAWKKVETPYFMLLGDDDGVSPKFIDVAKEIIDIQGPSVVSCRQAYVVLEDLGEFFPEGRVLLPRDMTGGLSRATAIDELSLLNWQVVRKSNTGGWTRPSQLRVSPGIQTPLPSCSAEGEAGQENFIGNWERKACTQHGLRTESLWR